MVAEKRSPPTTRSTYPDPPNLERLTTGDVPKLPEQQSAMAVEKHDWNWACQKLGVRIAPRGSANYDRVMELYRSENPLVEDSANAGLTDEQRERRALWKQCCAELDVKACAKGSDDYKRVMELYVPRIEQLYPMPLPDYVDN